MIKMLALKSFPYGGRRLKAGLSFTARGESDASVLVAIGHAVRDNRQPAVDEQPRVEVVEIPAEVVSETVEAAPEVTSVTVDVPTEPPTVEVKPETPVDAPTYETSRSRRSGYRRRDLRAEDSQS